MASSSLDHINVERLFPLSGVTGFSPAGPVDVERSTQEIGRELLRLGRQQRQGFFLTRFWSDRLMSWAMDDPAFKVQLFRFVDVFPMLRSSPRSTITWSITWPSPA